MYLAAKKENDANPEIGEAIVREITQGLTASPKYLPSKYFYDARGSKLFEDICRLPEYYVTRAEAAILKRIAPNLVRFLAGRDLIELGSGSEWKIRIILDAAGKSVRSAIRYIPMDICEEAVVESSLKLRAKYTELQVQGLVGDFTRHMDRIPAERPRFFFFLGSTIGNFTRSESLAFLKNMAASMKNGDRLMIGFDMVKDVNILHAAYNDAAGVTAEFNRNILNVINSRLDGDFDPSLFDHLAFYNTAQNRIEMHLKANRDCSALLKSANLKVDFRKEETIHTENSHKFTMPGIEWLARQAGLAVREWYTDEPEWFSLVLMGIT